MVEEDDTARAEIDRDMERGLAALEKEQYDVAGELFRRVIQRAPFRHDARNYLAFALDRQFSAESGQPPPKRLGSMTTASSAAAAASGRARASRIRFPMWLMLGAIVVTALVIVAASVVTNYGRSWIENWSKPAAPRAHPANEKLTAELKKADDAVQREQFDEALQILEAARPVAASLDPPDPKVIEDQIAMVYAAKARSFCSKENYDKALETAEEGLKHNDSLTQLNYVVGLCYERKGVQAASSNDKEKAHSLYEKSCRSLEKAVTAEPHNLLALDLLGKTYSKFGDEIKAIETWRRILKEAPESPEGRNARNYLESRGIRKP